MDNSHLTTKGIKKVWKQEAADILYTILEKGDTYSQASLQLSQHYKCHVPRHSCISYARRNFPQFINRVKPPKIKKERLKFIEVAPNLPKAEIVAEVDYGNKFRLIVKKSNKIARIEDLKDDGCKFTIANEDWCNCKRIRINGVLKPYCKEHYLRCYTRAA